MTIDAIVVGGGHNGLVCANYLAREGLRVILVEAEDSLGGAAKSLDWHGIETTYGATWGGMLRPEIVAELDLERFGLATTILDPQIFAHDSTGRSVGLFLNSDVTHASLHGVSERPSEALQAVHNFEQDMALAAGAFDELFMLWSATERTRRYANVAPELRSLFELSIEQVLSRYSIPEPLASAIAAGAISLTNSPPEEPHTGFALAYMATAVTNGVIGAWGRPRGSMAAVVATLRDAFLARGGKILTRSRITSIEVSHGRAIGVQVNGAYVIPADLIACCLHPHDLMDLLPESAIWFGGQTLSDDFAGLSATVRLTAAADSVVHALPKGITRDTLEYSLFVATPGSMDGLRDARRDILSGKPISETPLTTYSVKLLPDGNAFFEAYVQFVSSDCAEADLLHSTIQSIGSLFPQVPNAVERAIGFTPSLLDRYLHLPGGHPEHLLMRFPALLGARPSELLASYGTPIGGLFAGAAAWFPGGTVSGVPGRNCARAALAWLSAESVSE